MVYYYILLQITSEKVLQPTQFRLLKSSSKRDSFQMNNIIIESGATKGDWRVISPSGKEIARILTGGTNVSTMKIETVCQIISDAAGQIRNLGHDIENIYFYTAGVVTPEISASLTSTFQSTFPSANIDIANDLVAAARAACGRECGIVAILGTGSNSCLWDGEKITRTVRSGGFILGDEGSAAALGKAFVSDLIKGLVPEYIATDFGREYDSKANANNGYDNEL